MMIQNYMEYTKISSIFITIKKGISYVMYNKQQTTRHINAFG